MQLVERPTLADIPENLMMPCGELSDIPATELSGPEAAPLWGSDRTVAGDCKDRHSKLVTSVKAIKAQGN